MLSERARWETKNNMLELPVLIVKNIIETIELGRIVKKVRYKLEGSCKKCGECCKVIHAVNIYTEEEFEKMCKHDKDYRALEVIGRNSVGKLVFKCNLLDENGLCKDYKNRFYMCKKYPFVNKYFARKLHDCCGYKIKPEKSFNDYLK